MIDELNRIDTALFLWVNGKHNHFFDEIMYWASDKWFWIPFYLGLTIFIIRIYRKKSILFFFFVALCVLVTDQISASVIKPLVGRLRPTHNPFIQDLVHLNQDGPGGLHGFVSSHAANSFVLFAFLAFVLPKKYRILKIGLFFWASLVGYSRVYDGVHYPGDVLGGALLGVVAGYVLSLNYMFVSRKQDDWILTLRNNSVKSKISPLLKKGLIVLSVVFKR